MNSHRNGDGRSAPIIPYSVAIPGRRPGSSMLLEWYPEQGYAVAHVTMTTGTTIQFEMSGEEFNRLRRASSAWGWEF